MTYKTVTKVQALDGSLHESVEAARAHDARRDAARRRERMVAEVKNHFFNLWNFERLPPDASFDTGLPTQGDISEYIIDKWAELKAIVEAVPTPPSRPSNEAWGNR